MLAVVGQLCVGVDEGVALKLASRFELGLVAHRGPSPVEVDLGGGDGLRVERLGREDDHAAAAGRSGVEPTSVASSSEYATCTLV